MSNGPKVGEFCWTELATNNIEAAKEFYGKAFGWKFTEHDLGDTIYTMIHREDRPFAGMWAIPKDKQKDIKPHWMAYILVTNIEEAVNKAREHGAKLVHAIAHAGDFGIYAIIEDPAGAHVSLWQPLKME